MADTTGGHAQWLVIDDPERAEIDPAAVSRVWEHLGRLLWHKAEQEALPWHADSLEERLRADTGRRSDG